MKIIIATPLYPPEIAEPAPYTKEAARRLAKAHEITVAAYARWPEKIPGVRIISINKELPLLARLFVYTFALFKAARAADVIYAQNGASVELPAAIVAILTGRPLIIHSIDEVARQRAQKNKILGFIERFAFSRARRIITETPLGRPEILPFEPPPDFNSYNRSWDKHIHLLDEVFKHA